MKNIVITGASSGIGKSLYSFYKQKCRVIGISAKKGPDIRIDLSQTAYLRDVPSIVTNVDLLINCAGIMPFKENEKVMNVNFWGTYNLTYNLLKENKKMNIINIASISGMKAEEDLPIYAASKAAVISLTKSLAKKYAKQGIRVNCISPGFVDTNLVEGPTPQELIETIPIGREAGPNEIIRIVQMIENSPYMTGANIVFDGGVLL